MVEGLVLRCVIVGLATDDEWRARLVNQNRVDLVNDGEVEAALYAIFTFVDHVVAQIVKTKFIVGAVGDV